MGFLNGRMTCTRFQVTNGSPSTFGPEHLDRLNEHAIGTQRVARGDGLQFGWTAGDHIFDKSFDLAKNVVNDCLAFEFRMDAQKIPGDIVKAYALEEIKAFAASNPSGFPSSKQKREARLIARERAEEEAKDGRFVRRKTVPVLWDATTNELLIGTTTPGTMDLIVQHFKETFENKLTPIYAGQRAASYCTSCSPSQPSRSFDDARLTPFAAGNDGDAAWIPDEANRDFLGNEFLVWLWYYLTGETDSFKLSDGSEVAAMFSRSLVLECPRGQTGRDSIASDGPTRLPETLRAMQSGKLPRKAGLTLVRQDQCYELAIQAETLAITGAKLPRQESDDDLGRRQERVVQIRHLLETIDLLYARFLDVRLNPLAWQDEVARIQKWLRRSVEAAA